MNSLGHLIRALLMTGALFSTGALAGTAAIEPEPGQASKPHAAHGPALPGSQLPSQPLTEPPRFAGKRSGAMSGMQNLKIGSMLREQNKLDPNIVTAKNGLQYKVLKPGNGPKPGKNDSVKVYYQASVPNGTLFASASRPGKPSTFKLSDVVKGLRMGLAMMPTGSKWMLYIPPELGYGIVGMPPDVGPSSTLIYEVELVEVVPQTGKVSGHAMPDDVSTDTAEPAPAKPRAQVTVKKK